MVSLTQIAFRGVYIPEAMIWKTMVLIPKGGKGYIGIGLVEAIWKVCTHIVNSRIRSSIVLHDDVHGFRRGGKGITIMEEKL